MKVWQNKIKLRIITLLLLVTASCWGNYDYYYTICNLSPHTIYGTIDEYGGSTTSSGDFEAAPNMCVTVGVNWHAKGIYYNLDENCKCSSTNSDMPPCYYAGGVFSSLDSNDKSGTYIYTLSNPFESWGFTNQVIAETGPTDNPTVVEAINDILECTQSRGSPYGSASCDCPSSPICSSNFEYITCWYNCVIYKTGSFGSPDVVKTSVSDKGDVWKKIKKGAKFISRKLHKQLTQATDCDSGEKDDYSFFVTNCVNYANSDLDWYFQANNGAVIQGTYGEGTQINPGEKKEINFIKPLDFAEPEYYKVQFTEPKSSWDLVDSYKVPFAGGNLGVYYRITSNGNYYHTNVNGCVYNTSFTITNNTDLTLGIVPKNKTGYGDWISVNGNTQCDRGPCVDNFTINPHSSASISTYGNDGFPPNFHMDISAVEYSGIGTLYFRYDEGSNKWWTGVDEESGIPYGFKITKEGDNYIVTQELQKLSEKKQMEKYEHKTALPKDIKRTGVHQP